MHDDVAEGEREATGHARDGRKAKALAAQDDDTHLEGGGRRSRPEHVATDRVDPRRTWSAPCTSTTTAAAANNVTAHSSAPSPVRLSRVASSDEELREVTAEIFEGWLQSVTDPMAAGGVEHDQARRLATVFQAALEGGFLLSRTARDATAMQLIGRSLVDLVESAVRP